MGNGRPGNEKKGIVPISRNPPPPPPPKMFHEYVIDQIAACYHLSNADKDISISNINEMVAAGIIKPTPVDSIELPYRNIAGLFSIATASGGHIWWDRILYEINKK